MLVYCISCHNPVPLLSVPAVPDSTARNRLTETRPGRRARRSLGDAPPGSVLPEAAAAAEGAAGEAAASASAASGAAQGAAREAAAAEAAARSLLAQMQQSA